MGWIARLTIVTAVMSLTVAPVVPTIPPTTVGYAFAQDAGSERASRRENSGRSERASQARAERRAERAERQAERAERRAERQSERQAARAERQAARRAASDPSDGWADASGEASAEDVPTAVDSPVPSSGDAGSDPDFSADPAPADETPTQVDGPAPSPGDSEPEPTASDPDPAAPDDPAPDDPAPDDPAPADPAPADDTPTAVDGPVPSPADPGPSAPEVAEDPAPSDPAPTAPATDDDPSPSAPEPEVAEDPAPAPAAPASPSPAAPSDPATAPTDVAGGGAETPVQVDGPLPSAGGGLPVAETPVVETPVAGQPDVAADGDGDAGVAQPSRDDGVAGGPPTGSDAPRSQPTPLPSLGALIQTILRGERPAQSAPPPAVTPPAVTPPPVAPVVAVPVAPAPLVEPAPEFAEAAVEPEPEPSVAASAPRIELSSGGDRAETHRRYELTALGLTPRARQVIGALGFRVISERRSPLLGNRVVARIRTPGDQTAEAALARARAVLPEVTFDLSHLYRPASDRAPVRYAAQMIGAPTGATCPVPTRIGLIDSGVGVHPTLAAAQITRKNFVDRDAATNVAHGTAVASILVGDLPGTGPLMPGAQLLSANVFSQDSSGLRADAPAIIAALDWMAAQRVPVINLSLMGPPNALLEEAVRAAVARGLILVAAAGNDGPSADPAYPAAYAAVIAVAAVDARGRPYGRNNRGPYIYVAAPGVDIWGADARGGVAFWTGTSFAAPFVTASLARDLAQGRAHDINDGRARIASLARDLGAPGRDPIYGFGLLQSGGCGGTGGAGAPVLSSKR